MIVPSDEALELLDFMVDVGAVSASGGATFSQLLEALDIRRVEDLDATLHQLIDSNYIRKKLPSSLSGRATYYVDRYSYDRLLEDFDAEAASSIGVPPIHAPQKIVELRDEEITASVPASDRLVSFSHNSPDYLRIKEGLEELREAARSINDLPGGDRILNSLAAAASLWESTELKVIQIKVGIIMAIEDAGLALMNTAKAVATALMIDTLKSLIKSTTGIDVDHL